VEDGADVVAALLGAAKDFGQSKCIIPCGLFNAINRKRSLTPNTGAAGTWEVLSDIGGPTRNCWPHARPEHRIREPEREMKLLRSSIIKVVGGTLTETKGEGSRIHLDQPAIVQQQPTK
jgi:hypothetical protein